MRITTTFNKNPRTRVDTLVVGVYEKNKLSPAARTADKTQGGVIAHFLKNQKKFTGKAGQSAVIMLAPKADMLRLVIVGLGKEGTLTPLEYEEVGGKLYSALNAAGAVDADFLFDTEKGDPAQAAAHIALGVGLRAYRFDKYKTQTDDDAAAFKSLRLVMPEASAATKLYKGCTAIAAGVFLARDLVTEPANALYPDSYAKIIQKELKPLGVAVEIFDEKKLAKLGFHAHLAVAQGAENPARFVVMRWNGTAAKGKKGVPLALVGKGITFDTGGVNLKAGGEMLNIMKMDMGGSAAVVGAMKILALRQAKADVVAVVGLAENRMSHNSYLPGDVVKTLAGKTIEIHNTDAEGRLVLADALTYVQDTYTPERVIDVATLTGAVLMALGHEYGGAFVNDDKMWAALEKAGQESGDKLWRLPLHETYRKAMKGQIADMSNLGSMTPYGGTCTAAGFLEEFIDEGRAWAHLDIAGSAWIKADRPTCPKTFTGFGARLLAQFVADVVEG